METSPERRDDPEELLPIVRAKEANRMLLRARPNVVGLDVGVRTRQGEVTQERVLKVYVSRKLDASLLSDEQLIPATVSIDGREVGVDVEERAITRPTSFTLRDRPLRGGMSISTIDDDLGGPGTLGICVTLNDGDAYMLSNNHVLAGANRAPIGMPIIQPGESDGGTFPDDQVGALTTFVPLDFGSTIVQLPPLPPPAPPPPPIQVPNSNFVDAALAKIADVDATSPARAGDSFNLGNREVHWIGYPRVLLRGRWSTEQKLVLQTTGFVAKMGRTSEFTMGRIVSAFFDTLATYVGGGFAWFEDQLLIQPFDVRRPFVQPGDSGSLVVAFETGEPPTFALPPVVRGTDPVGLIFGMNGSFGVANPLDAVLDELGIPQL